MKYIIMCVISFNILAINILLPKAPPSLAIAKTALDLDEIKLEYYTDPVVELVPRIIRNEEYLYVIPVNLGAKLYERNQDLKLLAILSRGMLSIISQNDYKEIGQLDNKLIYIGGQGSSPDVISQYIFYKHNIKPKIQYRSSQEIAKLMISQRGHSAVLPEPLASLVLSKNKNFQRSFILKDLWANEKEVASIPQVGIFASKSFLEKNKDFLQRFEIAYEESLKWIDRDIEKAGAYALEVFNLNLESQVIIEAIKNMNLVFIKAKDARDEVEAYLKNLKSINRGIINSIPGDDFYQK